MSSNLLNGRDCLLCLRDSQTQYFSFRCEVRGGTETVVCTGCGKVFATKQTNKDT